MVQNAKGKVWAARGRQHIIQGEAEGIAHMEGDYEELETTSLRLKMTDWKWKEDQILVVHLVGKQAPCPACNMSNMRIIAIVKAVAILEGRKGVEIGGAESFPSVEDKLGWLEETSRNFMVKFAYELEAGCERSETWKGWK